MENFYCLNSSSLPPPPSLNVVNERFQCTTKIIDNLLKNYTDDHPTYKSTFFFYKTETKLKIFFFSGIFQIETLTSSLQNISVPYQILAQNKIFALTSLQKNSNLTKNDSKIEVC